MPESTSLSPQTHSAPEPESDPELEPTSETEPKPEPDLQTQIQTLHKTLTHAPPETLETSLTATGIRPTPEALHHVLLLSSATPTTAVKFFQWTARTLTKPPLKSWNLIIQILGHNQMFDEMWDAVRAMRRVNLVALSTFAIIFESYSHVERFDEAIMSFEVMPKYGVNECVNSVNLVLGFLNGDYANEFYERVKTRVELNVETFRVLFEGCERDGNAERALSLFGEMVVRIGWKKYNVAAYDAFLRTLIGTGRGDVAVEFLEVIRKHECLPSERFFVFAVESFVKDGDARNCVLLWDSMVEGGMVPSLGMYNEVIGLLCRNDDDEDAIRLFDGMVFDGAFPDDFTYNVIFECLLRKKKVCEVGGFFHEMVKNECYPSSSSCASAIAVLFDGDDPDGAVEIWDYLVENDVRPLDECGNEFLRGLCKLGRVADLVRFSNDMLDMEINIYKSTMSILKDAFHSHGKGEDIESIYKRWADSKV